MTILYTLITRINVLYSYNIKSLKYCIPFPGGSLKTQIGSWVLLSIKIYLFVEAYNTQLILLTVYLYHAFIEDLFEDLSKISWPLGLN